MRLCIPKETTSGETRVALVPADIARLIKAGLQISVQHDAGLASGAADAEYSSKGAQVESDSAKLHADADLVVGVNPPSDEEADAGNSIDRMKPGTVLVANLQALGGACNPALVNKLIERKITALSLDCVPRITRAQSMDILSSQATVAGYKAVLIAADLLPRMMPMLNTAAGTVFPAKVLVLGAGVAGLQAIATAKRLGAVVEAFDTRAAVKEQVQSLGARFVELDMGQGDAEGAGGYAKALTAEQEQRQRELLAERIRQVDVVITTALVPGRKAPLLIQASAVESMHPGSVIIDLAAERGGNCELTESDRVVVKNGVTICGRLNLPATLPVHASQMFSRNVSTLLLELCKNGAFVYDPADEILKGVTITHQGKIVHEPTRRAMQPVGASA